jgi:hypothetical protein
MAERTFTKVVAVAMRDDADGHVPLRIDGTTILATAAGVAVLP